MLYRLLKVTHYSFNAPNRPPNWTNGANCCEVEALNLGMVLLHEELSRAQRKGSVIGLVLCVTKELPHEIKATLEYTVRAFCQKLLATISLNLQKKTPTVFSWCFVREGWFKLVEKLTLRPCSVTCGHLLDLDSL